MISDGQYSGKCNKNYNTVDSNTPNGYQISKNTTFRMNESESNCYNPGNCSEDRAGNAQYSCFAAAGDQTNACRSTCVSGGDQDYSRKLYNSSLGPKTTSITAERGVELYENFGLQTDNRDYGLYGTYHDITTDDINPGNVATLNTTYRGTLATSNAINDKGRKVCLYGSVEFSLFDYGLFPTIMNGSTYKNTYSDLGSCPNNFPFPSYLCFQSDSTLSYTDISPVIDYALNNDINLTVPFLSGWVYRIKYNANSINPDKFYKYFGNSGIEIYSTGNKKYRITSKNTTFNKTYDYEFNGSKYLLSFYDNDTLYLDSTFWFLIPRIQNGVLNLNGKVFRSSQDPTRWNMYDGDSEPSSNTLCPAPASPTTHAYDGASSAVDTSPTSKTKNAYSGTGSYEGTLANPVFNSGFKSMYIPPHMEVQGFSESVIQYNTFPTSLKDFQYRFFSTWLKNNASSGCGSPQPDDEFYCLTPDNDSNLISTPYKYDHIQCDINNPFPKMVGELVSNLPLTNESSPLENGVFFTFGTNAPNSIERFIYPLSSGGSNNLDLNGIYKDRSSDTVDVKNAGGIYTGALIGIKVSVRTDRNWSLKYVSQNTSNNGLNKFMIPEIMLIPGFYQGQTYIANAQNNPLDYTFDDFQTIKNPPDYWTSTNPYYNDTVNGNDEASNAPVNVSINGSVDPWKCLPDPGSNATAQVVRTINAVPNFIKNEFHKTNLAKNLSKIKIGGIPIINLESSTPTNTSNLRINSFDIVNNIYSIEWIYVLMFCSIKCQQGVIYNEDTQQYTYSGSNCKPCMLFNDPYLLSSSYSGSDNFDSVSLMANYCGIRNLTFAYAPIKSLQNDVVQNECQCMVGSEFCPKEFNTACNTASGDAASSYYYVGSNIINSDCNAVICSYCNVGVLQLDAAAQGSETSGNINVAQVGDQCTDGCGTDPDDATDDDSTTDSATTLRWVIVILIIIIIVVGIALITAGVVLYQKQKKKKNSNKSSI